jgi:hypothetical protein
MFFVLEYSPLEILIFIFPWFLKFVPIYELNAAV